MKSCNQTSIETHPEWLEKMRNLHATVFLSDTKTYRLLMVIIRALIDNSVFTNPDRYIMEAYAFNDWFLSLAAGIPAIEGLTWLHLEVGQKGMTKKNIRAFPCEDDRLSAIIFTFLLVSAGKQNAVKQKQYFDEIRHAWTNCKKEDFKTSLYLSLNKALKQDVRSELVQLGETRGIKKSDTFNALKRFGIVSRDSAADSD